MVIDRPTGNKKAKSLDALDKKLNKQNIALQSASDNIASALNRTAVALEARLELKIWITDIRKCDPDAQRVLRLKRQLAERKLMQKLKNNSNTISKLGVAC
ncbi:unnamed protein product [Calypogeia fissa]